MSISCIVGPLTEAIEAETNLSNALNLHRMATERNLDTTDTYAAVSAAWKTADKANAALVDAMSNAPESKVADSLAQGVLLRLLRKSDTAPEITAG